MVWTKIFAIIGVIAFLAAGLFGNFGYKERILAMLYAVANYLIFLR